MNLVGAWPNSKWNILKEKLTTLVRMQRYWGNLWDMYDTRTESVYDEEPLPRFIRDPDSKFSAVWDITSVIFLLFVTATVPLRACFAVDVDIWSAEFYVDLVIDVFFITDVVINFRTAFFDHNGFREYRDWPIARNYMKGWFVIDLVSCLPVGYIQYFVSDEGGGDDNFRSVKSMRLVKMTKMMRLARIKRILSRHGSDVNYQQFFNIGLTLFTIVFMVHLLACFFYLVSSVTALYIF